MPDTLPVETSSVPATTAHIETAAHRTVGREPQRGFDPPPGAASDRATHRAAERATHRAIDRATDRATDQGLDAAITDVTDPSGHGRPDLAPGAGAPDRAPDRALGRRRLTAAALRFTALAVIVVGLGAFTLWRGPDRAGLTEIMRSHQGFGPAVAVFGSAVLTAALVPRTLLSLVGGLLFGWISGTGYVLLGVTLGAMFAFGLGRLLGREFVARRLRGRISQIEQAVAGRGVLSVIVCRMIPVVPFCVSNYIFGTTSMRLRPFVLGTILGALPATLAYAALGSATAHGNARGMTAAGVVVAALGIGGSIGTYLVWRHRPRKAGHAAPTG